MSKRGPKPQQQVCFDAQICERLRAHVNRLAGVKEGMWLESVNDWVTGMTSLLQVYKKLSTGAWPVHLTCVEETSNFEAY